MSLLKNLFILIKNGAIISALSYIVSISLANHLEITGFGLYNYIMIVGSIFSLIINYSTDSTASVRYTQTKSIQIVFNEILSFRLMATIILLVISSLFFSNPTLMGIVAISIVNLNFSFLYEINKKNLTYSYLYSIERFFYTALVLLLLYIEKLTVQTVFYSLIIVTLLSLIFQTYINIENIKKFKLVSIFPIITHNATLVAVSMITFVYGGISRLILEKTNGIDDLGVYSAGWQFVMLMTMVQSQIEKIWRLRFSKSTNNKNANFHYKNLKEYLLFTTLPTCIFAISAPLYSDFLIHTIYTTEYHSLNTIVPVIFLYFIVINLDGLARILWTSAEKRKPYLLISLTFGLSLIFILILHKDTWNLVIFTKTIIVFHFFCVITLLIFFHKSISVKFTNTTHNSQ